MENTDKNGLISQTKTIYDTGAAQIFWKNFLAGFSRALGGVFVYFLLIILTYIMFMNFIMPKLIPYLNTMTSLTKSLQSVSDLKNGTNIVIPNKITFPNIFGK